MTCVGECVPKCRDREQYVCGSMKCFVLEDTCNALREEKDELESKNHDLEIAVATLMTALRWMVKE